MAAASGSAAEPGAGVEATAPGPPGELTGQYELLAALTHKGRSADSGHYVAWVKQADGEGEDRRDGRGEVPLRIVLRHLKA